MFYLSKNNEGRWVICLIHLKRCQTIAAHTFNVKSQIFVNIVHFSNAVTTYISLVWIIYCTEDTDKCAWIKLHVPHCSYHQGGVTSTSPLLFFPTKPPRGSVISRLKGNRWELALAAVETRDSSFCMTQRINTLSLSFLLQPEYLKTPCNDHPIQSLNHHLTSFGRYRFLCYPGILSVSRCKY